jgi:crotonobetainyl-CoA:carnitine CoA-transferase CaiB-like acyl-CoA transferase
MSEQDSHGPLDGVRVVEFCQIAAGPFCGMLLADQGADVIKVESPSGDGMRQWPPLSEGYSENFASLNRNKRSLVLDLKRKDHVGEARALCLRADAVVENFRPGVMARLGLGYPDLAQDAPHLVYCSISAFGQSGPRCSEGGFDVTLQAAAGLMSVTGEPDGAPVKCGIPVTDFAAGLYAAFAVAAALTDVRRGADGRYIDVPMLGTSLAISALQTSEYFGTGRNPARLGSAHPRNAPYQAFRCLDGHFVLAAGTDELFRKACTSFGLDPLAVDPRFSSTALRAQNQGALRELIERVAMRLLVDECLDRLRSAGVPCAPINSVSQALADPQVAFYDWVQPVTLPNGVETRTFMDPLNRGKPPRRSPPGLGQHTNEILRDIHGDSPSANS